MYAPLRFVRLARVECHFIYPFLFLPKLFNSKWAANTASKVFCAEPPENCHLDKYAVEHVVPFSLWHCNHPLEFVALRWAVNGCVTRLTVLLISVKRPSIRFDRTCNTEPWPLIDDPMTFSEPKDYSTRM